MNNNYFKNSENIMDAMEGNRYTYEVLVDISKFLLQKISVQPKIGIICGSGMGYLADALTDQVIIPYEDIPNFPVSTVTGHHGRLVFGYLNNNIPVVCMQGRFHYYEGYPLWMCTMPVRVMKLIGVTHLIASNAAGGLNPKLKVGDIMIMTDHVNFMGFAGNNPLQGPNEERFGPRFLSMNKTYNREIIENTVKIATEEGFDCVQQGVYTCLGGPSFETVAELKLLSLLGIDAVGMSTVHEVVTARHCDMTVFAFSMITNICATDYSSSEQVDHEEVMNVGTMRKDILTRLITKVVTYINAELPV